MGIDRSLELLSAATDTTQANVIVSLSPIEGCKAGFFLSLLEDGKVSEEEFVQVWMSLSM